MLIMRGGASGLGDRSTPLDIPESSTVIILPRRDPLSLMADWNHSSMRHGNGEHRLAFVGNGASAAHGAVQCSAGGPA